MDSEEALIAYLTSVTSPSATYQITNKKKSPYATYFTLRQTYDEIPLYEMQLKICINKNNMCRYVTGRFADTRDWSAVKIIPQTKVIPVELAEQFILSKQITGQRMIRVNENNEPVPCYVFSEDKKDRTKLSIVTDENNNLILINDHISYFTTTDSTVAGKVFLPDPLTSANVIYEAPYVDDDDADNLSLNTQRSSVFFISTFEDDTFYLYNENVVIKDFAAPVVTVARSNVPVFDFTRSEQAFEDVNTFYHITNFNNYIKSLGYDSLQNFYIEIDTHGAGGADQSFFSAGLTPSIQYGEGGVDDAEDADVILHEYGHALSNNAAPETNSGFERRAIDEGYGDYFAVSYSRAFSDFNWQNVFSWDGHNEFWSGRDANTSKHYPEHITGDYYASSEIWSGALMDMYDAIGKVNADKIVFESLYGSVANMQMTDAAQVLLNAEVLIFGGTYSDILHAVLEARGLLPEVPLEAGKDNESIKISNTYHFTFTDQPLLISLPHAEKCLITITDLTGKTVFSHTYETKMMELKPVLPAGGFYFITVETENEILTKKFLTQ
ncbi:MAG: T9SS type A sorting domain-containing protein [Chitinophagales bacterium]|nr:T9SS type A sorting domain-containing protein [Chitinophagales bacterium]